MRIKFRKDFFTYFAMAFLFVPPAIISVIPSMNLVSSCITMSGIAITAFLVFEEYFVSHKRMNSTVIILLIFILWLEMVNVLHFSIGRNFLKEIIPVCGMILCVNRVFRKSKELVFLEAFSVYGTTIVVLNLLSQILCGTNGLYHDWTSSWQAYYLCGNANSFVFFYLLVIGTTSTCSIYNKKWTIPSYLIHFSMLWSFYLLGDNGSSTGFLILAMALMVRLMSIQAVKKQLLKYYKFVIAGLCAVGTWFFIAKGWESKWFLDLAQKYAGGSGSMIARGTIWNSSMERIKESPIIGNGTNSIFLSADLDGVLRSAHNNFFEICIMGGIPALIIYLMLIWSCVGNTSKKSGGGYMFFICIILNLIAFFVEQNPFYIGFYMLLIIYRNLNGGGYWNPQEGEERYCDLGYCGIGSYAGGLAA